MERRRRDYYRAWEVWWWTTIHRR